MTPPLVAQAGETCELPPLEALRGGTLVTVAGLNLANGSHSHRCRFGEAGWAPGTLAELGTPADPDGPRGAARTTLRCVAPLASALAATEAFSVTLSVGWHAAHWGE